VYIGWFFSLVSGGVGGVVGVVALVFCLVAGLELFEELFGMNMRFWGFGFYRGGGAYVLTGHNCAVIILYVTISLSSKKFKDFSLLL